MVNAELKYNPYLKETIIRFNGKEPRVNSLVEKYEDKMLQTWIKKVPQIFHDEMNGYDFELEFSGTQRDFDELCAAFRNSGIDDSMVHIFLKNELNGRQIKESDIRLLLAWMNENLNTEFNLELFKKKNEELFEGLYPFIIVHGNKIDTGILKENYIQAEFIEDINELKNANLENVPVVIVISKQSYSYIGKDINCLISRNDINEEQIFFLIKSDVDKKKAMRDIEDFGIQDPKSVDSVFDGTIKKYMEIYPISSYIYDCIKVFKNLEGDITKKLNERSGIVRDKNEDTHKKIEIIDGKIENLKKANNYFINRDNFDFSSEWETSYNQLMTKLHQWRLKKVKIIGEEDASFIADELNSRVRELYDEFTDKIEFIANQKAKIISKELRNWYLSSEYTEIVPEQIKLGKEYPMIVPNMVNSLLALHTVEQIPDDDSGFGKFFKHEETYKEENVYYYDRWREYTVEYVSGYAKEYIERYSSKLSKWLDNMTEVYKEKINGFIELETKNRTILISNLSDEEKIYQSDMDWLWNFKDQLENIERG